MTDFPFTQKQIERMAKCVARGAAWLDSHVPEWWKRIKVKKLQLENTTTCVLGQVFSKELHVLEGISDDGFSFALDNHAKLDAAPSRYGFEVELEHILEDDVDTEYSILTTLWIQIIAARKQAAKKTEKASKQLKTITESAPDRKNVVTGDLVL